MEISAPSLRRGIGVSDPEVWTTMLLSIFDSLIQQTEAGDQSARQQLEAQMLHAQQVAYQNPFVSCSHEWGIAQSFALADDTPGHVLTIDGDETAGVDFRDLRQRHRLFGDAVDHLDEFGIRRSLDYPFAITKVHLVAPYGVAPIEVYP